MKPRLERIWFAAWLAEVPKSVCRYDTYGYELLAISPISQSLTFAVTEDQSD